MQTEESEEWLNMSDDEAAYISYVNQWDAKKSRVPETETQVPETDKRLLSDITPNESSFLITIDPLRLQGVSPTLLTIYRAARICISVFPCALMSSNKEISTCPPETAISTSNDGIKTQQCDNCEFCGNSQKCISDEEQATAVMSLLEDTERKHEEEKKTSLESNVETNMSSLLQSNEKINQYTKIIPETLPVIFEVERFEKTLLQCLELFQPRRKFVFIF
ncbi:hypothetical protein KQX54_019470 [Cotesia glomerata]|uniref:Uncharacterized protein n=1 Tax=Cotesia glomerata TaxID=32391 RepID=A0AAV7IT86_COTGL|nr:hypothetical protein KQX54_019470 [Cotesia glomerata]